MIVHTRPRGARPLAARAEAAAAMGAALRAAVDAGEVRGLVLLELQTPYPSASTVSAKNRAPTSTAANRACGSGTTCSRGTRRVRRSPRRCSRRTPTPTATCGCGPDLATLAPGPAGTWYVVCDVEWPDGRPVPIAPRTALRDQLAAAEELDLIPSVGLEHEVTFTDPAGEPLTGGGLDYAAGGLDAIRPLLDTVESTVDSLGLGVESRRGECHPGQYESVLGHRDALAACDDAMLQQLAVRRAAAEHGVRAGYLAAERAGAGSSCHVHLSLSSQDPAALDRFVAGVLVAARDLTAIWAPTWNSYVRLRTAGFAPTDVRAGVDDRTAAVRIAGSGASRRLEARFAGADAQPHLVVAALLASGTRGVRESLPTPEPGRLHETPWEALRALDESTVARSLLGDEMVNARVALLSDELQAALTTVTDWQRHRGDLRA